MTSASKTGGHLPVLLQTAAAWLAIAASPAMAASVTLCAEPYTVDLPGAPGVPMWGYRQVSDPASCSATSVLRSSAAAPLLTLPAGDSTLEVTLVNRLTVPTSVVLAGQALPVGGAPVHATDVFDPAGGSTVCPGPSAADLSCRVRSFTTETAPGASATYSFANLKPGSFLLQSGTHPQVQVQMGLFAAVRQDAQPLDTASRRLYRAAAADTNAGFDVDASVLLSEIDAAQHLRIASTLGTEGQQAQWKAGGNSTFNYAPRHFLINGRVFNGNDIAASDIGISAPNGSRVVLRLANAGLQSRLLMLNNGTWKLLTEDGNPYAAPREQATVLLPAGKTSDAAFLAAGPAGTGGTSFGQALFDRRGGTDNADGTALGGQVARLAVTNAAGPLNHPPVVNAGVDQTVAQTGAATAVALVGTAGDDGLNQALVTQWSASGPAAVNFSAPNALASGASFTASGTYRLQLSAFDGEFTVVDEMLVSVVPPPADLSITKTDGVSSVMAGTAVTYTLTVANAGPTAVTGASVVDALPAALTNASWTCAPAASCAAASGTGSINTTVSVGVGGSVSFSVTGTVASSATGTLVNTATVAVPVGISDPNPANNSATDTDTILPAPPALPVLDTFNRANANTLGGNWSQVVLFGAASIRVNANQASDVLVQGAAYWNASGALGARQAAAFTLATAPTAAGNSLLLKASGGSATIPTNFIRVRSTGTQVLVETTTNAGFSYAALGSFTAATAIGDRLVVAVNETGAVQVWKLTGATASYLGQTGPSTFTGTGRAGMQLQVGARVDDFGAATLP